MTPDVQDGRDLFLYLTTRGRRSGTPREIEIWYTQRDGRYFIIAEHADAHWVKNILADSAVSFRINGSRFEGQARIIQADKDPRLNQAIQELSRRKYGWGEGLVVELRPDQ